MIEWMQKHKKYLIVTIWISTIAFVASGAVGIGSAGITSSVVASVGDLEVTSKELNEEYARTYARIKARNKFFNQEFAKQINLQDTVLKNLINKKYILNFAKDTGIIATDEEVIEKITTNKNFLSDGNFSSKLYKTVLLNNNLQPKEYEKTLRENIIVAKTLDMFKTDLTGIETKLSSLNTRLADSLKLKVLDRKDFKIKVSDKEIKSYWDKNKNTYKTNNKYKINIIKVKKKINISKKKIKDYYAKNKSSFKDINGKILPYIVAKDKVKRVLRQKELFKQANKLYYDLKNKKIKTQQSLIVDQVKDATLFSALTKYQDGDFFKPIKYKKAYIIGEVVKSIKPKTMTYKQAKSRAKDDLKDLKSKKALIAKSKQLAKHLKTKTIKFVSKQNAKTKLKSLALSDSQKETFMKKLMDRSDKKGFVIIKDKSIVFNIVKQKILKDAPVSINKIEELQQIAQKDDVLKNIKNNFINDLVINSFKDKYEVSYTSLIKFK